MDKHAELLRMVTVWLEDIEAEAPVNEADAGIRRSLRAYTRELSYRLNQSTSYRDDLDRAHKLRQALRSLDPFYDAVAELEQPIETYIQSALNFFAAMSLDLAQVIHSIEVQYPQWADAFANERKMYAEWQQGRGPLAGEPWHFEDEAEIAQA